MKAPALVLLALSVLASSCASGEDAPVSRAGWGSITEEAPPPPVALQGALSVATPSVAPYPEREFSLDERAFFDLAWNAFKNDEARWPAMKAHWISMGPEASGLLAMNLYRGMVAARAGGALDLVERARKDLLYMGEGAVPALIGGLSVRAVRRDDGEEIRVGQDVLHQAAELLSIIGAPSVPGLMDIASSGEKTFAQEGVFALGNIGDPRAEDLLLRLSGDTDWSSRAAAVLALRKYRDATARDRMVAALEDAESYVSQCAAQGLVTEKRTDALPGILAVLERGVRDGRIFTVRSSSWALQKITGQNLGTDPAAWRAWLEAKR